MKKFLVGRNGRVVSFISNRKLNGNVKNSGRRLPRKGIRIIFNLKSTLLRTSAVVMRVKSGWKMAMNKSK